MLSLSSLLLTFSLSHSEAGFVKDKNPDDVYEIPSLAARVQKVSGASMASVMEAKVCTPELEIRNQKHPKPET